MFFSLLHPITNFYLWCWWAFSYLRPHQHCLSTSLDVQTALILTKSSIRNGQLLPLTLGHESIKSFVLPNYTTIQKPYQHRLSWSSDIKSALTLTKSSIRNGQPLPLAQGHGNIKSLSCLISPLYSYTETNSSCVYGRLSALLCSPNGAKMKLISGIFAQIILTSIGVSA